VSDMIEMFRDLKDLRKHRRATEGVQCPVCREKLPKAHAKILLPGQTCRAHNPHYRDPRDETTTTTRDGAGEKGE
jgi:hypothetical protein